MKKYDEYAEVLSNQKIAAGIYALRLRAPEIAQSIQAGQFVQLDCGDASLTLRRPFSVFLAYEDVIEILYQVVGKGSDILSFVEKGRSLKVLGPLGKGWEIPEGAARALLVAGGLGAAPLGGLVPLLEEQGIEVDLAQGAQSEEKLIARDYFLSRNCQVSICTDDGSFGTQGFVTTPVAELVENKHYDVAYVCGPEGMMKAVSQILLSKEIKTFVSLERRMACGLGACLSCVVQTEKGPRKACKAGPVFDAEELIYD